MVLLTSALLQDNVLKTVCDLVIVTVCALELAYTSAGGPSGPDAGRYTVLSQDAKGKGGLFFLYIHLRLAAPICGICFVHFGPRKVDSQPPFVITWKLVSVRIANLTRFKLACVL